MKTPKKMHTIDVPKECIGAVFTHAGKCDLQLELVEIIGMKALQVDLVYSKTQRMEVMTLIEIVDDYLQEEEERKLQGI